MSKKLTIRVEDKLFFALKNQAKKKIMSLNSSIINNCLFSLKNDSISNKSNKKEMKELENIIKLNEVYFKIKDISYKQFLFWNTQKRIFNIIKSNLIASCGEDVGMEMVKHQIKLMNEAFSCFPQTIKKQMKPFLKDMQNYLSEDYVRQRFKVMKLLEDKGVIHFSESKIPSPKEVPLNISEEIIEIPPSTMLYNKKGGVENNEEKTN